MQSGSEGKFDNVCAIKGLGIISVATVVAETNGFIYLKTKAGGKLCRLTMSLKINQEIILENTHIEKGNPRIRRILYMPALVVKTCQEPAFINLYNRTFERHGIKMKSYVAIQKKNY
ncbi:MAG: transposase [Bacteroidetes bacterium]|nr:transposase [Bacteroidota bacterium]